MSDSDEKCALLEKALEPILSEAEGYLEVLVDDIHLASDMNKAKLCLAILLSMRVGWSAKYDLDYAKEYVQNVIKSLGRWSNTV